MARTRAKFYVLSFTPDTRQLRKSHTERCCTNVFTFEEYIDAHYITLEQVAGLHNALVKGACFFLSENWLAVPAEDE